MPSPRIYTFRIQNGASNTTAELYSAIELWQRDEEAGRWQDQHGNALQLAAITRLLPDGFADRHLKREELEAAFARTPNRPADQWVNGEMGRWIRDFTGIPDMRPGTVEGRFFGLKELVAFRAPNMPANRYAYAFALKRPPSAKATTAPTWFFLSVDVNPAVDAARAGKAILTDLLPSLGPAAIANPQANGPSARFQNPDAQGPADRSAEFLASRGEVADSIRNLKDWWYVETGNYILLSNLPSRYRVMVQRLQSDLEGLRGLFVRTIPPRRPISAVSVIRVFATSEEYVNYVGKDLAWSGGLWDPTHKELIVRAVEWGGHGEQCRQVQRATFHEAFHQYLFYAFDKIQSSPWYNEGHASFFETARVNRDKVVIADDEEKIAVLRKLLADGPLDIPGLLRQSYADFYGGTHENRMRNYALAWGLVYYLRRGAPLEKPPLRAGILGRCEETLWNTRDADAATDAAFKGVQPESFRKAVGEFWKSGSRQGAARRLGGS